MSDQNVDKKSIVLKNAVSMESIDLRKSDSLDRNESIADLSHNLQFEENEVYEDNKSIVSEDDPSITKVYLNLRIKRLGEVDTSGEKFSAEVIIESEWIDNELVCVKENKPKLAYDAENDWNPQLYIENILTDNKENIKYNVRLDGKDHYVKETKIVKGLFWERLELQEFPVDVQELSVTLTSKLPQKDIKLVPLYEKMSEINLTMFNTFTDQQKFSLFKLIKISDVASYDMGSISSLKSANLKMKTKDMSVSPKLVLTHFVARKPVYYYFNAFFHIFLFTMAVLFIFSIGPKVTSGRFGLNFTSMLTSINFKFVMNRSLPKKSYLTSLDKYSNACLLFIVLSLCYHALIGSFTSSKTAEGIDKWFLLGFCMAFLTIQLVLFAWLYYANRKVRNLKKKEIDFLAGKLRPQDV